MSAGLSKGWKGITEREESNIGSKEERPLEDGFNKQRRTVLKGIFAQIAFGTLAAGGALAAPKDFNPKHYKGNRDVSPGEIPKAKGWLVTDPMACAGCKTCEIVCSLSHDGECKPALSRVHTESDPFSKLDKIYVLPQVCRQCNIPDCYLACAYDALVIDRKTGARIIIPEKCIGCLECYNACPWDMITHDEENERCTKCDLCGGDPQCVKYCPASALKYVSLL